MTNIQIEHTRTIEQKQKELEEILSSLGRVLIGYSGGVDSAVLAVAAHRVLGDNAIAVTADSESYASGELESARQLMRDFGIRHEVVRTHELENPDYSRNPINRCYFCKQELFTHMNQMATEQKANAILYGQNTDDVGDFRPGAQAAKDYGVRAPLQEAGLNKQDVRALAKQWGLPVWNRPAMACLSSRFPYGTPVTAQGLRMVDRAESFVRKMGFEQLRVRHHSDIARIELPPDKLNHLLGKAELTDKLYNELITLGYGLVAVDLRGFRSGSLNEVLTKGTSGDADAILVAQKVLEGSGFLGTAAKQIDQMLIVKVATHDFIRFADENQRNNLVQQLQASGMQYMALDLASATHTTA